MAVIQDLSPDVLGYIFEHVHLLTVTAEAEISCREDNDEYSVDLSDPALFPCSIAHVSLFWREVISRFSRFWTRFAVDLGSPSPLLDAASWGLDQDFSIIIFDKRRSGVNSTIPTSAQEEGRVGVIMESLSPHLHRCTSLEIQVFHYSSIPNFPTLLCKISEETTNLKIDSLFPTPSSHTSATAIGNLWKGLRPPKVPSFSDLRTLSLDVAILLRMNSQYPLWWEGAEFFDRMSLTLSDYEFGYVNEEGRYTTRDFFACLMRVGEWDIATIRLKNLSVRPPFDRSHYPSEPTEFGGQMTVFETKYLSTEFMFALCSYFNIAAQNGRIEACGIPSNIGSLEACELELVNLAADVDLIPILDESLFGWYVSVEACPSFNDDVVRALTNPPGEAEGKEIDYARNITILQLSRCDALSLNALRVLVETRGIWVKVSEMPLLGTAEEVGCFNDYSKSLFDAD